MRVNIGAAAGLNTGRVASFDSSGNIEWQTTKWLHARGSFDSTMACKPLLIDPPRVTPQMLMLARRNHLYRERVRELLDIQGAPPAVVLDISGSPAKFLQGHNAFGSDDVIGLGAAVISRCVDLLGLTLTQREFEWIEQGDYRLLRTDVNYSYSTGSRSNCLSWLQSAEKHSHLANRGRGSMTKGETLNWGARSSYWSLKAYCKGQEMTTKDKAHRPSDELPHLDQLLKWADDKLRIELQCNARYLTEKALDKASAWKSDTPAVLHSEHLGKLTLSGEVNMKPAELEALPPALRQTYLLWSQGHDIRDVMSRATFYRRRRELLDHGIDIAVKSPDASSNVVPLIRTIEAVPCGVPDWALGTALYFEPRRRAG